MKNTLLFFMLASTSVWADFINGNFSNGLNGWTGFTTTNGINALAVGNFDTTGNGSNPAARMFVGTTAAAGQAGGGIQQSLNLGPGSYTVSADLAAVVNRLNEIPFDLGLFQLLANDVVIGSYNFGVLNLNQTQSFIFKPITFIRTNPDCLNCTLAEVSGNITNSVEIVTTNFTEVVRTSISQLVDLPNSGEVNFKFQFIRDGLNGTTTHYIDNIAITANGVPEPSTLALMASGVAAAWFMRRKRK